jgi:hypothetical protein
MTRTCRLSTAGVLMVCWFGSYGNGALIASALRESGDESGSFPVVEQPSDAGSAAGPGMAPPVDWDLSTRARLASSAALEAFTDGSWFAFKNESRPDWRSAPDLNGIHRGFAYSPSMFTANAAGQVYQGRPYRMRRDHNGAVAAVVVGAIATITGAAILVYANRPECRHHEFATGCGYGTKVVGGAVLSGGVVGLTIGALTWR